MSQREQVWTGSTILFQISNFDSKLHLKRRYFFFQKKTFEFWLVQTPPENDIANQFLIDNSKYGVDNTVINEAKKKLLPLHVWRKGLTSQLYVGVHAISNQKSGSSLSMLVIKKKGVIALIQRRNEIGFYNKKEKLVISIEYVLS